MFLFNQQKIEQVKIMTSQPESEILLLREKGLTPKEIARKLSLKPFQVNAIIKSSATQKAITKAESGELAAITHYKNDMGEAKQCNKLDSNFSKFQFVTSPEEFRKLSPKKREIQTKEVIASLGSDWEMTSYKTLLQEAIDLTILYERAQYSKDLYLQLLEEETTYPDFKPTIIVDLGTVYHSLRKTFGTQIMLPIIENILISPEQLLAYSVCGDFQVLISLSPETIDKLIEFTQDYQGNEIINLKVEFQETKPLTVNFYYFIPQKMIPLRLISMEKGDPRYFYQRDFGNNTF